MWFVEIISSILQELRLSMIDIDDSAGGIILKGFIITIIVVVILVVFFPVIPLFILGILFL